MQRIPNKYQLLVFIFLINILSSQAQMLHKDYSSQADSVLQLMTLEEKIGQLNQYSNDRKNTGPVINNKNHLEEIRKGKVGSMLNVTSVSRAKQYQEEAMKSRLRIPLLFGMDVVHGMKTIFPIPMGEAASFDLELMRKTAEIAAAEASAHGLHWTFAPMIDIARDARWGRVMEGAGEDTWYGSEVAKARVKGFQGNNYNDRRTVLACAKHFAAYGVAIAGKDYTGADISENTLHQVYLPPFRAAIEADVATFMSAFNDVNGIPATAHKPLMRDLLKETWKFNGFVVSDWGSVGELQNHRVAANAEEAALLAVTAGCDMDMCSASYIGNLEKLVKEGKVDIAIIDDAVKRILTKKFELGLFDDPFGYNYREAELDDELINKAHRKIAREAGNKSIVLLKNNAALPLPGTVRNIALVGPLCTSRWDMIGNWGAMGKPEYVTTILDGFKTALPNCKITHIEGYDPRTNEIKELPELSGFDVIIVAVGEKASESGEAKSKVDININSNHQQLVKRLKEESNKPVIALVMGGRPLVFSAMEPYADAILVTWWLGVEAGNSIADVITGKYNPSAKLPMTYPRHSGQCPIYYNHKSTGRPWSKDNQYTSRYIDEDIRPAYPFGYGLSYTTFHISAPVLSKEQYGFNEKIILKTTVKNTGNYKGKETVQLYLQDVVSSVTRPVIELCGFQQVELEKGEEREIEFVLTSKDLGFFNIYNEFVTEPGEFKLFVGNSSENATMLKSASFYLAK
ncbi:glycoside hydrolase family 3 N-terminal domain-containing protein [Bacteroides sp. 519]|uniref:glycoside hydrolase family 3 N-terminal domain-containing protein n=1 Tax=Bacteroides sp. 519 TaxID=2302937 RepID=UPI0013D27C7F|nr:glycoside hydrolase family 3 N-terminal domain-containing protein [Bacteroides sp. 519]NDV59480.1 glycosyl hydrolase [Bacteroides sp. 519]